MPSDYQGSPSGGAFTTPVPGRTAVPGAALPVDGDAANAASVAPGFQSALDWLAYLQLNGSLNDALGGLATSFDGPSNPAAWNDLLTTNGTPISGLDVLPTFAAGSGFAVSIGAGSGYLYTSVSIHPGESDYRWIWWSGQGLTLANPDGTNPRIDAITVTTAAPGTPSTLDVVTGTPSATPMPPVVPAGSGALFYVLVPAAAANAAAFRACRGLWRRCGYPWSGMSAIVAGCELSWDYTVDPATTGSTLYFGAPDLTSSYSIHRLLIDGEPIEFTGFANGSPNLVADSTANPFGTAASSSFDRPYYVYVCGGRHNPLPSVGFGSNFLLPVTVCESTVPPNPRTGKPTANLTVNGVTVTPDGAVYVGLGFVVAGSTRRRGCLMDGEMTCCLNPLQWLQHSFTTAGYEDLGTFSGGAQPVISTKMRVNALFQNAASAAITGCFIKLENFALSAGGGAFGPPSLYAGPVTGADESSLNGLDINFTPRSGAELWATAGASGSSLVIAAVGFNHRVRRLVAGY